MVSSYRMAQQSPEGWMPTFPEVTGDSHRMNGNHAVAVIWMLPIARVLQVLIWTRLIMPAKVQ